ncbi:MAG: DUF3408 domain-containing protein [Massilibacteroides sp.]|nr:DUF3408 domain-containing protein [Eubacteriales bacterium]MDD4661555.1 DUF3408 domain-containing protein [Massilibacteroides sp.]
MVHQGVPLEKTMENTTPEEVKSASVDSEVTEPVSKVPEPPAKPLDRRKRKPQADYQSLFFNRIDFTHRKPLYITATTHRRLMRIVHLMDESKATISSYVENIILNHLDTFKEEIDTIYQTNNINPTE